MSTYCISDIHGCAKTFKALLNKISLQPGKDILYIIGDLIDRGPDSAGVVQHVLDMRAKGFDITCLRGNHEDFLLTSQHDENSRYWWMIPQNGGGITLKSYGIIDEDNFWELMPQDHRDFYLAMPIVCETAFNTILVHAGLDFRTSHPVTKSSEHSMLWDRDFSYDKAKLNGRQLVTGHTPTDYRDIARHRKDDHLIIDSGCVFEDYKHLGYGVLTALRLDDREVYHVDNCE